MGMKYIEVEQAIKEMMQFDIWDEEGVRIDDADEKEPIVRDWIDCVPLADVQEVRHGRWVEEKYSLTNPKCSLCNEFSYEKSAFCPSCGAKMDRGE
jgi:hypothetical protein